jgi:hypothetical protein
MPQFNASGAIGVLSGVGQALLGALDILFRSSHYASLVVWCASLKRIRPLRFVRAILHTFRAASTALATLQAGITAATGLGHQEPSSFASGTE